MEAANKPELAMIVNRRGGGFFCRPLLFNKVSPASENRPNYTPLGNAVTGTLGGGPGTLLARYSANETL